MIDPTIGQTAIEEMRGRSVVEEVRAVLAADQIHMIDAEIGGNLLIAGRLVMALPLDPMGNPATQPIRGSKETDAVVPGSLEFEPEAAIDDAPRQCGRALRGRRESASPVWWQGPVDVGEPQHRQAGDDFGDLGAKSRHFNC